MKEDVLDVLMYLFEAYVEADPAPAPDPSILRGQLEQAGFRDREIDQALTWLDGLNRIPEEAAEELTDRAVRVFSRQELARLDTDCRGYLMHLEQIGILSPAQRELAIDRIMALDSDEIDVEQIKWVVLMVLFSQPGQEAAYSRMEDLVFEEGSSVVH
jgi:Smg protein